VLGGVLALILALAGVVLVLLMAVGDEVVGVSTAVASFLWTSTTPAIQAVVVKPREPADDQCQLVVPRASNCSSVTDTKEDKANDICKGLAKELEPLPETKAIVGAEGFLSLS
jgi:hypothetical protein